MKNIVLSGMVVAVALVAISSVSVAQAKQPFPNFPDVGIPNFPAGYGGGAKVMVCHNGNTIAVSPTAVQARLRHGDTLGACEDGHLIDDSFLDPYKHFIQQTIGVFRNLFNR